MSKDNIFNVPQILSAIDSDKLCKGKQPIGGKGKRTVKRKSKKTGLCPMCGSTNCSLTYSDFSKHIKLKNNDTTNN